MIENSFLKIHSQEILPEWIDYNGHMNVAYYVRVFDLSLDELLDRINMTRAYRDTSGCSVFVLETHVTYLQEVKEGDQVEISVRVINYDEKRMHLFLEMHHKQEKYLAATSEQMILHVDASGPKAHPMPAFILDNLKELYETQKDAPAPDQLGRKIGIRKKQSA